MVMKIADLERSTEESDDWIKQFEEGYWSPLAMFASVVEEIGELGREINDIEGYKKRKVKSNSSLELELGDIVFSLVCLANYFEIDLEKAFTRTLNKYSKRDSTRWALKAK